jgi:DNA-3-methyladenine glycosylase II
MINAQICCSTLRKMKHIKVLGNDKKLSPILSLVRPFKPKKEKDLYFRLMRAICGQQLSTKAAATIWNRFLDLFPERYPYALLVTEMDVEKMRQAGLSYQKAGYLKGIAEFSRQNDMTYEFISKMNDEDIIAYLTQIKGVGRWTVQMLLMFCLGRKDVFPVDDQGIINGMRKLYKLKEEGKALRTKCSKIAERWKPYRSYACYYLWPYTDMK